jgi:2-oxoisovalerate dehydrogenase E1 component
VAFRTSTVNGTLTSSYLELANLDLTRDLEGHVVRITAEGLTREPRCPPELAAAELLQLYYHMALTRAVDLEVVKLIRKGFAHGKHLMCTGNEATVVGATSALRATDWVTLGIRDLGAFMVRGVSPARVLAQACGRLNGLTNGWDGSLHMGSRDHRIAGLVSHLGTLPAIGVGCGFAEWYQGTDNIVLSFVGEGTTSTGDVHEALNIASVLHLPLVLVIENNQWAFGTPSRLQYAVPTLALRALAYGAHVEGCCIDGTDVLGVYQTVREAVVRARTQQTITIIDSVSMRLEGHSLADPFTRYVPAEQLEIWKTKDPIARFRQRLLEADLVGVDELLVLDRRIAAEVTEAALEAEGGPVPDGKDLEARIFAPSRPQCEPPAESRRGTCVPYYRAIQDGLREEMDRDSALFMIGEDIGISDGAFKITEGFSKRYDHLDWQDYWRTSRRFVQRRVIDAPIAEAGFSGLALGAVLAGLRAVVEFQYADFASEAFKMIVNYAATQTVRCMGPVPVVFRMPSGWAPNTSLYHSVNPESWFASTPGLKIVAPITAYDAKGLIKASIRDDNPVLFLEYKAHYRTAPERLHPALRLPVPDEDYVVPIGKARVVLAGSDVTVVTYGSQVHRALAAAEQLAKEDGVTVELIDLRTLVPYDRACVQTSVRKTSRAVVTCEAPRTGAFGNTLVTDIIHDSFDHLDAPVRLVAAANTPVPFAPSLEEAHLPTTAKLVAAIRDVLAY